MSKNKPKYTASSSNVAKYEEHPEIKETEVKGDSSLKSSVSTELEVVRLREEITSLREVMSDLKFLVEKLIRRR